jgi:hypothetical protein
VRRLFTRAAAIALTASVALGAAAMPCAAADAPATGKLTRLSPASRQLLVTSSPAKQTQTPSATAPSSSSFFGSTKGKVTLALMGAGVGLTLWSIHHDRIPVKSPVR